MHNEWSQECKADTWAVSAILLWGRKTQRNGLVLLTKSPNQKSKKIIIKAFFSVRSMLIIKTMSGMNLTMDLENYETNQWT